MHCVRLDANDRGTLSCQVLYMHVLLLFFTANCKALVRQRRLYKHNWLGKSGFPKFFYASLPARAPIFDGHVLMFNGHTIFFAGYSIIFDGRVANFRRTRC